MSDNGQTELDPNMVNSCVKQTAGRRQRPTCPHSDRFNKLVDAKESFSAAVREGLTVLKNQLGYSHERATTALLRELSRGDLPAPNDEEIFSTMQLYAIGIDEAVKAITISNVLRREMAEGGLNEMEAIHNLTTKVSSVNLVSIDNDVSPSSSASDSEEVTIRPRSPEVRIKPMATRKFPARSKLSTATKKPKPNSRTVKHHKSKPSVTPVKGVSSSRKRSMDESDPSNYPRARADSICDEVQSKIARISPADTEADVENSQKKGVSNVSVVRAKRSRVDDSEITSSKRPRTSETLP